MEYTLSAVGSLMYLAPQTCPDISYTIGLLTCFNSNPDKKHWDAVKHLMRYINGTLDYHITYRKLSSIPHPFATYFSVSNPEPESPLTDSASPSLAVYSSAAHGDCQVSGNSTGGYWVMMNGIPVSWRSKLQTMVSLSTTEAEYIAGVDAGKEIKWVHNLLFELGYGVSGPSPHS
jgi:hypothetical protein